LSKNIIHIFEISFPYFKDSKNREKVMGDFALIFVELNVSERLDYIAEEKSAKEKGREVK